MKQNETIAVKTFPELRDKLDVFNSNYKPHTFYLPPEPPIPKRIPRQDRVCRFCNKTKPEVRFKNDPHNIPTLLGVNYGVSDYECDNCNNYFSRYESDLAHYLGLKRTIMAVGRNKIPKFTSPKEALLATITGSQKNKSAVTISDLSGDSFRFNAETSSCEIMYLKNGYTPINVFKCLLKIALSILPDDEIGNYQHVLNFILNNKHVEHFIPFARVLQCMVDYTAMKPYCLLFESSKRSIPRHLVYLCFDNLIYQFFIPYHIDDGKLYEAGREINLTYTPPLFFGDEVVQGTFRNEFLDFSATEKLSNEKGYIRFKIDKSMFTDAYDVKTKQFVKKTFIPEEIVKIILTAEQSNLDLEDL